MYIMVNIVLFRDLPGSQLLVLSRFPVTPRVYFRKTVLGEALVPASGTAVSIPW